jgi:hypothetical protein
MPEVNPGQRYPEGGGSCSLWRGDNRVETGVPHGGHNFRPELPVSEKPVHAKNN